MPSRKTNIRRTLTQRGLVRYQIEVYHGELSKFQLIRGEDPDIVESKARAKIAQWDEMWMKRQATQERRADREQKAKKKEEKKSLADQRTGEAKEALAELEGVLAAAISGPKGVDWDSLKNTEEFPDPKPDRPPYPTCPPRPEIADEPKDTDSAYQPTLGFLDKLLSGRREAKIKAARDVFERDHRAWAEKKAGAELARKGELEKHETQKRAVDEKHKEMIQEWEDAKRAFLAKLDAENEAVDERRERFMRAEVDGIADAFDVLLETSSYPDCFPQSFDLDYNPENKMLVVDYELPAPTALPTLSEVSYVQSKDEFKEKHISNSALNKLYDALLYEITLRTLHELFSADAPGVLEAVVFNGFVRSVDPATGQETHGCVLSVQAGREEFAAINLAHVEPKACFRKLKGVGSSKLHGLAPVAPLLRINREDSRFVDSYDVADSIQEGDNLAAMDWEDFEHLIRELFEKEFAKEGGDVRVTQASRDGGIDAVVFDPDPLRGGKIVIQAKRYTNTVGVSAVRDLYGTVMNEGANKGILVSTADYGPDAYDFVKDKPLVLLNGSNLLHMLGNHGYKAKIDLVEAKKLAAEREAEDRST